MTGLEKITTQIIDDAKASAQRPRPRRKQKHPISWQRQKHSGKNR